MKRRMYLFLAAAKRLARWDKGDCQTHEATKSLSPVAPDSKSPVAPAPKFRCCQSALTKDCFDLEFEFAGGRAEWAAAP